jgi:hypothetical protein
MADFRPIETAPHDGSTIGAWSAREPALIRIVRWGHHLGNRKVAPSWVTITKGVSVTNSPTHWVSVPNVDAIKAACGMPVRRSALFELRERIAADSVSPTPARTSSGNTPMEGE